MTLRQLGLPQIVNQACRPNRELACKGGRSGSSKRYGAGHRIPVYLYSYTVKR